MTIKYLGFCFALFYACLVHAAPYSGPSNPNIPSDQDEIRIKLEQCIEDFNDVATDTNQEGAKNLCTLREAHKAARQQTLESLAALVKRYKGMTNQGHDEQLYQTISLIQLHFKTCMEALASQESCHNVTCVTDPENDAIFCNKQSNDLIQKILKP